MNDVYNNIDWNRVWTDQIQKSQRSKNRKECSSIWEDRESAKRFWNISQRDGQKRAKETIKDLHITPHSKVLDIGAGPGTLSIPISEKVGHVTAVEPSKGMLEVLDEKIAEYRRDNISIVRKRWEDIDVEKDLDGPYDVVIASFSLGMPDIRRAIEDMQAVSSDYIYLYWFAGNTPWDEHSFRIWPALHGSEYHPSPKCDILFNVLYQMGIYPHLEPFIIGRTEKYLTLDEAVNEQKNHFAIENEQQRKILKQYFQETLQVDNEKYVYDASSTRVRIWWSVKGPEKMA
ncbi:Methyltransferase type 12 [Methanosalsum zhilinae DSM 4017]|uniref:Methyltransferase type 12 n=1 Tax=Methanosalsum zhilinae (strain DSM 4017 / NBRC 107636 / OCM 62 / WeN5) TaxID=679901 RepID=F7XLK6_METZD|nr:class I SAM-dependent methyltransferase [Methanosalsum zhilinae]AEH60825.1 Methyltransferase type 12 [Methanosalsum zhilinae DSM 4017]